MKNNPLRTGWLVPGLLAAFAITATADSVRLGGGLRPGFARPPLHLHFGPLAGGASSGPYSPAQIRHAYGVDSVLAAGTTGRGQVIGIVDAYGDPSIQADLDTFSAQYGIPSTTVQFRYPQGTPGANSGWALETALDVEWAHALAPDATIVVSVAKSASITDLLGAVDAAVSAGADVISMSWGATEFSSASAYESHFQAPGVTFVASSGDSGELATTPQVEWPASSPSVVSVGGTSLYLDASGSRLTETAWSSSGGGLSSYFSRPSYQGGWNPYANRGVPDVSLVADPNTGVGVFYGGSWYQVGGTSAGAPMWAALIALANQAGINPVSGPGNPVLYSLAGTAPTIDPDNFFDITTGNNGGRNVHADDYAVPGYDLVTGLGSAVAPGLILALVPPPDFTLAVSPGSQPVAPGAAAAYTVTVGAVGGFGDTVAFSVAGLPAGAVASFNPASVTGSGSATLMVTTVPSTPTGNYPLSITGTSGSGTLTHAVSATLVVANADFAIAGSPASQTVRRGRSGTYTVTITPAGGFSGTVGFNVTGLPANATASFSPSSLTGSGSSRMTVRTSSNTPRGTSTLTITGTSGTLSHSTTVSLTVN